MDYSVQHQMETSLLSTKMFQY